MLSVKKRRGKNTMITKSKLSVLLILILCAVTVSSCGHCPTTSALEPFDLSHESKLKRADMESITAINEALSKK